MFYSPIHYGCLFLPIGVPSTATKAKPEKPSTSSLHQALSATHNTGTAYHPTQLASALNYSYNPLTGTTPTSSTPSTSTFSATGFPVRGFPASSTKVVSGDRGLPGSGRGLTGVDWSGFGDTNSSMETAKKTVQEPELTSK